MAQKVIKPYNWNCDSNQIKNQMRKRRGKVKNRNELSYFIGKNHGGICFNRLKKSNIIKYIDKFM